MGKMYSIFYWSVGKAKKHHHGVKCQNFDDNHKANHCVSGRHCEL